ncbi:hypothetical protein MHB42_02135 [Lysinibacillus sp. FSL K6-0232]
MKKFKKPVITTALKKNVEACSINLWQQLFYHKDKWLAPQMEGFIKL